MESSVNDELPFSLHLTLGRNLQKNTEDPDHAESPRRELLVEKVRAKIPWIGRLSRKLLRLKVTPKNPWSKSPLRNVLRRRSRAEKSLGRKSTLKSRWTERPMRRSSGRQSAAQSHWNEIPITRRRAFYRRFHFFMVTMITTFFLFFARFRDERTFLLISRVLGYNKLHRSLI